MQTVITRACSEDVEAIFALLQQHHLPPDGLRDHLATTRVARRDGRVVGSAAVEVYPEGALLRSVAVAPELQGQGSGTIWLRLLSAWRAGGTRQASIF